MRDEEEFWDEILAQIEAGKVIPVVGPELLTVEKDGKEVPLYRAVAEKLLEKRKFSGAVVATDDQAPPDDRSVVLHSFHELNDAVCALASRGERIQNLYRPVNDALKGLIEASADAALQPLKDLASITAFKLFITTTPDNLLARAIDAARHGGMAKTDEIVFSPNLSSATPLRDLPPDRSSGYTAVCYLFGKSSPSPVFAIHDEDTLEFIHTFQMNAPLAMKLLYTELCTQSLLLIGCNFPDWLSRFFIRLSNTHRLTDNRDKHEFVIEESARSGSLTLFLERFSPDSWIFPGNAKEFVAALTRRWQEKHPATDIDSDKILPRPTKEDTFFISYSREDLPAAKRLLSDLQEIGADVAWFDKSELAPGDLWDEKIRHAIKACYLFLPLISANTEKRDEGYFHKEWDLAAEKEAFILGRKFIIPIVIDRGQLVDCRLLRIEHQGGIERVELMHDRLTDVVREHRDRERELAVERARSQRRRWRRWLLVATGFLFLGLIIFGGVVLMLWQDSKKAFRRAVAGKLVMQSRAILEGNKAGNPDTALLLAAAGFELHRDGNAYGALQYALQALPWPGMKIVSFPDMVKAISQDGSVVATLSNQNLILREVATGKSLGGAELQQKSEISAVAFSSDCRTLASGSARGQVQLWDVETGKQRGRPIEQHDEDVTSLAFSPDGSTLASGGTDRAVRLWDASTGKQRGAPLQGHSGRIVSVAFSPDGRTLASASSDKTVRFWNVTTGKPRGTPLQGHTESVAIVIFSPDGRTLASGSSDKTVRLWDVASGKPRGTPLKGHENAVCSLAFSLDARTLASGSADNTVRLWDIGTGKQRGAPLKGHSAPVLRLAFSWDGRTLASGTGDENVRLWDVSNETSLRGRGGADLRGHTSPVQSVAFSPDGRTLASGSDDETVRLWDLASGKQRGAPLLEHSGVVFSVAFSPDGKTLASGRSDGTVRLWDVATGKQRGAPLRGHTNSVTSVAFSPTAGPWLPGVGTGRYGCGTWQPASFGEFRCRGKTKGYQAKGYQAWRITSTARPWRPGVRMGPCGSGT